MQRRLLFFIILVLLLTSLAATPRLIDFSIDWWAIGPSSAILQQGEVELQGVIGQGIAGEVSQPEVELCSGYLCIFSQWIGKIFLPLIAR
jgi:hypothetical protein